MIFTSHGDGCYCAGKLIKSNSWGSFANYTSKDNKHAVRKAERRRPSLHNVVKDVTWLKSNRSKGVPRKLKVKELAKMQDSKGIDTREAKQGVIWLVMFKFRI